MHYGKAMADGTRLESNRLCARRRLMTIAAVSGGALLDQRATVGRLIRGVRKIKNWSKGTILIRRCGDGRVAHPEAVDLVVFFRSFEASAHGREVADGGNPESLRSGHLLLFHR